MYHPNMKLEPTTRASVSEMLRAHGITPTHQRIEIALVLFEKRWHPSADEILAAVNVRYAESSKATVYNTLKLLRDKGLVRELIVDPSKVFYDSNTSAHHHFYNVASGEITDIPAAGVRIDGLPPVPAGMVTDGIDIVVRTRPGL
jgi:Fur family iron response transcriptional regulator